MSISRLMQMGAAGAGGPGKYLLDNSTNGKLLIYEITNTTPVYVSTIEDSGVSIGSVQDVKYDADAAIFYILSDNPDRFSAWDVSDFSNPTKLNDINVGATTNTGNGISLLYGVPLGSGSGNAAICTINNNVVSVDITNPSSLVLRDTRSISSPGYGSEGGTVDLGITSSGSPIIGVQEDSVLRQIRVSSISDISSVSTTIDTSRLLVTTAARPLRVDRANSFVLVSSRSTTYSLTTWSYTYGSFLLASTSSLGLINASDWSLEDRKIFACDNSNLYARNVSTSGVLTNSGTSLSDSRFDSTEALAYDYDAQIVYTTKQVSSEERNIYLWDVSNTSSMSFSGAYNVYPDVGGSVSALQFTRIIYEGVSNN